MCFALSLLLKTWKPVGFKNFKKKERNKEGHPKNTHIPQAREAEVLLKILWHYTCSELTQQWFSGINLNNMPLSNHVQPLWAREVWSSASSVWMALDSQEFFTARSSHSSSTSLLNSLWHDRFISSVIPVNDPIDNNLKWFIHRFCKIEFTIMCWRRTFFLSIKCCSCW